MIFKNNRSYAVLYIKKCEVLLFYLAIRPLISHEKRFNMNISKNTHKISKEQFSLAP